jgi:tetratricopeptide (TPR) repeat protein
MTRTFCLAIVATFVGLTAAAAAQGPPAPPMLPTPPGPPGHRVSDRAQSEDLYRQARVLIDEGRYEQALGQLDRLIQRFDGKGETSGTSRVDAAFYWKAYTLGKRSQTAEALATLEDMQKKFAGSRWIRDARALEVEIRQASGQPVSPEAQADEDLKLLALRGLIKRDPHRALPMVEQLLTSASSERVKGNALFVLSQSRSARARAMIASAARNPSNPDLQIRAIRYLGVMRADSDLAELYQLDASPELKQWIVQSLFFSGSRSRLAALARTEKDPELQKDIVSKLAAMK